MVIFNDLQEHDDTNEAHERRIVRCSSCRARIIFLPTMSGKRMPVYADTVEATDEIYAPGRHESHFAKCPNANQFRKRK